MPTYEYRCPECDRDLARVCSVTEYEATKESIFCEGSVTELHEEPVRMQRVFSAPSFSIQGLAADRFKYEDKIAANRQKVHERGVPDQ